MNEVWIQENKYPIFRGPLHMCCYCQMMFISEQFLDKHQKKCIQMKFHSLLKTKLQLRTNNTLNEDRQNATTEDYFCEECFCGFLQLTDYESHLRDHHPGKKPFQCYQCDRTYTFKRGLRQHIATHHAEESFNKKSETVIHNQSHSNELRFVCPKCPRKFTSKAILIEHLKRHPDKVTLDGSYCEPGLSRNNHLASHSKKSFDCEQCTMTFSKKFYLKKHMLIHSNENYFDCNYCSKYFLQKDDFDIHMLAYHSTTSFVCDQCGKSFREKCVLTGHLLTHVEKKPFSCEICDKSFLRRDELKKHSLTHPGATLSCVHCNEKFSQVSSLNRHLNTHSRAHPFGCDYCDKSFPCNNTRKRHLITHLRK